MKVNPLVTAAIGFLGLLPANGQQTTPLYQVTVVERTTQAINYQYRSGPTRVDFRGTVLMPEAKGEATVESKRGRTTIDCRFDNVTVPTRFGQEYLTYVLWAITPEGGARNIGEVVPNGSDKAKLRVTSDLQAFGMIVTAEPYASVRLPSDVVVLENQVRADTAGNVVPINVKHELMPRGHFTWEVPEKLQAEVASARKVSMDEYDAQSHVYQAENAIGIARAAGAGRYAADTLAKAERLLTEAQRLQASKGRTSAVVQNAREAAQTAEDARAIAEQRAHQAEISAAREQAEAANQAAAQAQAQTQRALAEANAARERADAERAAREQAEAAAAAARDRAARAEAVAAEPAPLPPSPPQDQAGAHKQLRHQLLQQLSSIATVRDTPRGLVATFPDAAFSGSALRQDSAAQVTRLAAVLIAYPDLRIDVEGSSDTPANAEEGRERAGALQRAFLGSGIPASRVESRGLGDTRPLTANSTGAGREQNRRVEAVISGESIGSLPTWDHAYPLSLR